MTYNPYRHASELGVTIVWEDETPVGQCLSYCPVSKTMTLNTKLSSVECRSAMAVTLALIERNDFSESPESLFMARSLAAKRLVDPVLLGKVSNLDENAQAKSLGISVATLRIYLARLALAALGAFPFIAAPWFQSLLDLASDADLI